MINHRLVVATTLAMVLAVGFANAQGAGSSSMQRPKEGFGSMMGRDLENLPVGTSLTHEVKKLSGQALFSDRLIPVFFAGGIEYEMRLPPMAFAGTNLKQGESLEIQGIFSSLKTPDGKIINWVRPLIVKVAGKEINLEAYRQAHREKDGGRQKFDGGMGPGMGPGMHAKPDGSPKDHR